MDEIYVNVPQTEDGWDKILTNAIHDNMISLSLVYDSDFKSSKILRDIAEKSAKLLHMDDKWISRIILICDELNNNAVEYGSLAGEKNVMRFEVKKES
jgi:anti-sigma regulatory factor (Ser/Thr protein kinase)